MMDIAFLVRLSYYFFTFETKLEVGVSSVYPQCLKYLQKLTPSPIRTFKYWSTFVKFINDSCTVTLMWCHLMLKVWGIYYLLMQIGFVLSDYMYSMTLQISINSNQTLLLSNVPLDMHFIQIKPSYFQLWFCNLKSLKWSPSSTRICLSNLKLLKSSLVNSQVFVHPQITKITPLQLTPTFPTSNHSIHMCFCTFKWLKSKIFQFKYL